ncbi:type-2 ice-structuring protein-like [Channa argus]
MSMKIVKMSLLICGMLTLVTAAMLVSETRDTKTPRCPTNWTPYNDRCYYCNSTRTSWDDAENCCQSQNGHLALMASVDEYDFIQQLVMTATKLSQPVWLRGSTSSQVGRWALFELALNFHLGSPAQLVCPAAECCLVMNFGDKKFGPLPCSNKLPFVCEKDQLQP